MWINRVKIAKMIQTKPVNVRKTQKVNNEILIEL